MVSDKEINSLLLKFNKIHKSNISARRVKYYTIAETLNRLTEGKANLPTTDYVRHQLYESGLSFDKMYKMSDRFANQLILENSPDDCFSQESQKVLNQSNMQNNTTENTNNENNENNGENTDNNNNVEEDEGDVEGSEYDAKEGGFNQGGFNEDDFKKMSISKEQQIADSARLARQETFANREQMAKNAEELSDKVKQGTLDVDNLEITVNRLERGWGNGEHPYTTGKMYINGHFFCYTIENYDFTYAVGKRFSKNIGIKIDKLKKTFNIFKDKKTINAKVAIPAGQYTITNKPTTKYNDQGNNQDLYAIYKYQCIKDQNGKWKPLIKNGHKVFMTVGNKLESNAIVPRLDAENQDSGFGGILIHGGYNPSFSNGCILIVDEEPKNGIVKEQDIAMLSHSKLIYDKLWNMIQRTQSKGGKITITINADNENVTSKPPQNAVFNVIKNL